MLVDSRTLEPGGELSCEVCIVGGGAAGITLALALAAHDVDVCLLESGGLAADARTQELYRGPTEGPAGPIDSYLSVSRVRYLGGSTNHWEGWCRPLDAIDFEARPWVPASGWPIGEADLAPHYERAAEILEIEPFDDARDAAAAGILPLDPARVVTRAYHFSPPVRFGVKFRAELESATSVRVLLHANATRLRANEAVTRVQRVEAATLDGPRFALAARHVVLAAGGVENARLLLLSDDEQEGGLGNGRGLVGRYFMEHPHISDAGRVVLTDPGRDHGFYQVALALGVRGGRVALLHIAPQLQRERGLLNVALLFRDHHRQGLSARMDHIGHAAYRLDRLGRHEVRPHEPSPYFAPIEVRLEQAPNPESRVTLAPDTDELGLRRARLAWRTLALDAETIMRALEVLALELGRASQGRIRIMHDPEQPWRFVYGASHHMGTTRMAAAESAGVVDRDCRVFGLDNLYIAGSSVFPTVGVANPTFTIVALTLRLAEHLAAKAAGG